MEKTAAPKGVKDKALWNKIEKHIMEYSKYKGAQLYKAVSAAYQRAGGEYTHKSKKAESLNTLLNVANKIDARLNKQAGLADWDPIHTESGKDIFVAQMPSLGSKKMLVQLSIGEHELFLTKHEAVQLAKALSEAALSMTDKELEQEETQDLDDDDYEQNQGLYGELLDAYGEEPPMKVLLKVIEMHGNKAHERNGKIVADSPDGRFVLKPNLKSVMEWLGY